MSGMNNTLIIGIGNLIRGDDAIGILLARELVKEPRAGCTIIEMESSGFEVLDMMGGYDRVIIIDAMRTDDESSIGEVVVYDYANYPSSVTILPSHGMDFTGLIKAWQKAHPAGFPEHIHFILVKVIDVDEFKEGLSQRVTKQFDEILDRVRETLNRHE
jgi:hydrogenase maturation protease